MRNDPPAPLSPTLSAPRAAPLAGPHSVALAAPLTLADLADAWRLLRAASARFDRIAREEGWSAPVSPAGVLILAELDAATAFGLTPRTLARRLGVAPSTLAHHLDGLEAAELIDRSPRGIHDGRKVAVRITPAGRYAVRRLLAHPPMRAPAMASP